MLRKIRIALAAVFFVGITLLLIGIGSEWFGWMAKLQFLPSMFALNLAVVLGILLLTLLLGRLYCSVICPLGVFQDIVIRLRRAYASCMTKSQARKFKSLKDKGVSPLPKPRKFGNDFKYRPEKTVLRYAILVALLISVLCGIQLAISLVAPYSAYGRLVSGIAGLVSGAGVAPALLVVAGLTFVLIVFYAWCGGREWCNTICPVGSILGLVSRFSLFRPVIDKSKCISCGKCVKKCKSACIDGNAHKIDMSRCVVCFDCIGNCSEGAIKYKFVGWGKKDSEPAEGKTAANDESRRKFLATSMVISGAGITAAAQNKRLDGGLAAVVDKEIPARSERLVPPGALSVKNFYDHCTGCQLCVDNCPNGVLRPSTDLRHFLQPQMGYENGYCRPECTVCSTLCPAGAIHPIERDEKLSIRIGTARVNLDLCLAAKGEAGCGNCQRHCPSGAIRMVKSNGINIPVVNEELCVGCGACEFLCPSRPISAITVDGLSTHINKI